MTDALPSAPDDREIVLDLVRHCRRSSRAVPVPRLAEVLGLSEPNLRAQLDRLRLQGYVATVLGQRFRPSDEVLDGEPPRPPRSCRCLRCRDVFLSSGPHNRVCLTCRNSGEWLDGIQFAW
jgi:hypothetical protein